MSINKAQAAALADGFLDSLGEGKDGLRPRETLSELFLIAGEFVEDAQKNLKNSNASGKLSASLVADSPVQNGKTVRVDIKMNYYGKFVNKGVKGLSSGSSLSGYKFKSPFPSEAMVKSLEAGISRAKKSTSNTNTKKTTSQNEKKNNDTAQSRAFGAGVNIKKHGIKATQFLDKAAVNAVRSTRDRLGATLKVDILNSITNP